MKESVGIKGLFATLTTGGAGNSGVVHFLLWVLSIPMLVCFGASVIGAICGIGGGVIIKPVLDLLGIMSVSAVSFCSGCTVLAMTTYSVIKGKISKKSNLHFATSFPLAIGGAVGGIVGKELFSYIKTATNDEARVGMVQTIVLFIVTAGTLIYTLFKEKIKTQTISNVPVCILIGLVLGVMSSFLGIGGGPINLVVLYYFFSMTTKVAAENSLYIIFFSQLASLIMSLVTRSVPEDVSVLLLVVMIISGILGGIAGRKINSKIDDKKVNTLFIILMVVMLLINVGNMLKFGGVL